MSWGDRVRGDKTGCPLEDKLVSLGLDFFPLCVWNLIIHQKNSMYYLQSLYVQYVQGSNSNFC